MNTAQQLPAQHTDLSTLKVGEKCYGVSCIAQQSPLAFTPLPAGAHREGRVCGLIQLADGAAVPVFDLRAPDGKTSRYQLLIATGCHGANAAVSMAILIDTATENTPRARSRATPGASASVNLRN